MRNMLKTAANRLRMMMICMNLRKSTRLSKMRICLSTVGLGDSMYVSQRVRIRLDRVMYLLVKESNRNAEAENNRAGVVMVTSS